MIHTGSRNLGKQVADLYQKEARKLLSGWDKVMEQQKRIIEEYKSQGRKMQTPPVPPDLCYLEGEPRNEYLHDMRLCQRWARLNRRLIADLITDFLEEKHSACGVADGAFESVHNYISDDNLMDYASFKEKEYDRMADILREHLDMEKIYGMLNEASIN